jgi:hypothetical protein
VRAIATLRAKRRRARSAAVANERQRRTANSRDAFLPVGVTRALESEPRYEADGCNTRRLRNVRISQRAFMTAEATRSTMYAIATRMSLPPARVESQR